MKVEEECNNRFNITSQKQIKTIKKTMHICHYYHKVIALFQIISQLHWKDRGQTKNAELDNNWNVSGSRNSKCLTQWLLNKLWKRNPANRILNFDGLLFKCLHPQSEWFDYCICKSNYISWMPIDMQHLTKDSRLSPVFEKHFRTTADLKMPMCGVVTNRWGDRANSVV